MQITKRTVGVVRLFGIFGNAIGLLTSSLSALESARAGDRDAAVAHVVAAGASLASIVGIGLTMLEFSWAGPLTLVAGLIALGAVIAAAVLTDPPLIKWLKTSTWGTHSGPAGVAAQLESLFQLLLAPRVEAREHVSLPAPGQSPARGKYGLCVTVTLPMIMPSETRVELDVDLLQDARVPRTPMPLALPVHELTDLRLRAGPVSDQQMADATRAPVLLDSTVTTAKRALDGAPALALATNLGAASFSWFLPLRRPIGERPGEARPESGGVLWGRVHLRAAARVVFWTGAVSNARPGLALKPFELAGVEVGRDPRRMR